MSRMKKTMLACAALVLAGQTLADEQQELKQYLSGLSQFTAQFSQSVFDGHQTLLQQSTGDLAIARPNKLRWHVTEPDEELLISDGEVLWLYSPFLEQVSVFDLSQAISQSPFMLLTSDDELVWADYEINKNEQGFRITPRQVTNIAWLQINLAGQSIQSIVMLDSQGKRSEFKLSNFKVAGYLAPNSFHFDVPEGTDIDDQRIH